MILCPNNGEDCLLDVKAQSANTNSTIIVPVATPYDSVPWSESDALENGGNLGKESPNNEGQEHHLIPRTPAPTSSKDLGIKFATGAPSPVSNYAYPKTTYTNLPGSMVNESSSSLFLAAVVAGAVGFLVVTMAITAYFIRRSRSGSSLNSPGRLALGSQQAFGGTSPKKVAPPILSKSSSFARSDSASSTNSSTKKSNYDRMSRGTAARTASTGVIDIQHQDSSQELPLDSKANILGNSATQFGNLTAALTSPTPVAAVATPFRRPSALILSPVRKGSFSFMSPQTVAPPATPAGATPTWLASRPTPAARNPRASRRISGYGITGDANNVEELGDDDDDIKKERSQRDVAVVGMTPRVTSLAGSRQNSNVSSKRTSTVSSVKSFPQVAVTEEPETLEDDDEDDALRDDPKAFPKVAPLPQRRLSRLQSDHHQAAKEAQALHEAFEKHGHDENLLISVLATKAPEDAEALASTYRSMYNKELVQGMAADTHGWLKKLLIGLCMSPECYDAICLEECMKGIGCNEDILTEILVGRTASEIRLIKIAYEARYRKDLVKSVASETKGKLQIFYHEILKAQMVHHDPEDIDDISAVTALQAEHDLEVVQSFLAHSNAKDDEPVVTTAIVLFATGGKGRIAKVAESYKSVLGDDLCIDLADVLEKTFKGDFGKALAASVAMAMNPAAFTAKKFEVCMKGIGHNHNDLIRLTVRNRRPEEMRKIKSAYYTLFNEPLYERVKSETKGHYQKCLLEVIHV